MISIAGYISVRQSFFVYCDEADQAETAGSLPNGLNPSRNEPGFLMNDLGSHELPEVVSLSIPDRCESQRQCKAGSGSFRLIRFIVVHEKTFA